VPISRSPLGRPPVSTREEIEEIAFELLLRNGYAATTVEAITSAAGVSRTTLFRYFGSKGAIVWGEFDRAVERLRAALADSLDVPVVVAVQAAVVTSTRLSRDAAPDTWLDRFRVLDRDPALVAETAAHWNVWSGAVAGYVSERSGLPTGSPVAAAVGGAIQAAYIAVLRDWVAVDRDRPVDIDELERALEAIAEALQAVLDQALQT
jgi:AcrR family transcriptional regulator